MNSSGLKGKTIVVTRSVDDSIDEFVKLSELGAKLIHFPTLEYMPVDDWRLFDSITAKKGEIDFLVFTSANSVKFFSKRCRETGVTWNFDKTKVVAVGKKTAQVCADFTIPVYAVPDEFNAVGISKFFEKINITGKNIFIPGSELSRNDLAENLRANGNTVFNVPIYKVGLPNHFIIEEKLDAIKNILPDAFVFTSPSTFKNILEIMKIAEPKKYFENHVIVAIGKTTQKEIESYGIKVNVMPKISTVEELIEELIKYYN